MVENNHFRLKYTHMLPNDVLLWEKFLSRYGSYYDRFEYDVHVGRPPEVTSAQPENIRRAAWALMLKRIDAVGYHGEEVTIFEVKPDAGLSALGQVLGYRELFVRDRGMPAKLKLAVVTDIINPDEEYLFSTHQIRVFLV